MVAEMLLNKMLTICRTYQQVTDYIHPFDINHVFFTRLERGPIPDPPGTSAAANEEHLQKYILKGLINRDPIQMLYDYMKNNAIVQKSVQAAGGGGGDQENFEDKYIRKFFRTVESHAGRVEGELELRLPTDLRALYHVPFSAADAAKNPDAVKALNDCCLEWVQSADKGKSTFKFTATRNRKCFKHNATSMVCLVFPVSGSDRDRVKWPHKPQK